MKMLLNASVCSGDVSWGGAEQETGRWGGSHSPLPTAVAQISAVSSAERHTGAQLCGTALQRCWLEGVQSVSR